MIGFPIFSRDSRSTFIVRFNIKQCKMGRDCLNSRRNLSGRSERPLKFSQFPHFHASKGREDSAMNLPKFGIKSRNYRKYQTIRSMNQSNEVCHFNIDSKASIGYDSIRFTLNDAQIIRDKCPHLAIVQEDADNSIKSDKLAFRPKPAFFPRRTSNRFATKSDQTTPKDESSTLAKRRLILERRRSTSSPSTVQSSTEASTKAPNTRPTRLFVRKYSPRSGTSTRPTTTTSEPIAKSDSTSRKNFRIGLRRRPSVFTTESSVKPIEDTTASNETDQESHSTIHQTNENTPETVSKRVRIQKRPLTSTAKTDDKQSSEKIYSSVIKEDKTLVQQEKPIDINRNEVKFNGDNVEDVTAEVAVVAHQLLSAPLPTIPSYALDDESDHSDGLFTRAYLLASSASPIVTGNTEFVTTATPYRFTTPARFSTPTKSKRISTTVSPIRPTQKRRKTYTNDYERIEPIVKNYRTFVDYEYYDDDDIRIVGKSPVQGKVVLHGKGRIQCLDQGNFPHPESCKKFISCARMENGEVYGWAYTCPIGLSFDPVGGICNWSAGLGCSD